MPPEHAATPARLRELTRHVMVDFVQMKSFAEDPLIMVGGDGIYLSDVEGRRYVDGLSGATTCSTTSGRAAQSGPVGTAVQQEARRRGLLVRASPHNTTLAPPLVITSEEVDEVASALEDAVDEVGRLVEANGPVDLEVSFGI